MRSISLRCPWFVLAALVAIPFGVAEPQRIMVPANAVPVPDASVAKVDSQVAPATYEVGLEKIQQTRTQIEARLKAAEEAIEATRDETTGESPAELVRVVELLKRLDAVLKELSQSNEQLKDVRTEKLSQESSLKALRTSGPTEPTPYSFLLLDRLREELRREESRSQAIGDLQQAAADDLERTRQELLAKQQARRAVKEKLANNSDPENASELQRAFEIIDLEVDLAAHIVQLAELKVAREQVAAELQEVRVTYLREKVAAIDKEDMFSKDDLDRQITELDKQEDDVKRDLVMAEVLVEAKKESWLEAQRRLREQPDQVAVLKEEVEVERLSWENPKRRIEVLNQRSRRLAEMRHVWQRRYQLAKENAAVSDVTAWQAESRGAVDQLNRDSRLISTRIDELRKDLATLESKIQTMSAEETQARVVMLLNRQKELVQQRININEMNIVHVEAARRLHEKLLEESEQEVASAPTTERLADGWAKVSAVWNHEVLAIDDQSITVRKIVLGLALVLIGLILSRIASKLVGRRLLPRLGFNDSASAALQSVAFYIMLLIVFLCALNYVNVPLTAFTVLGGAIALGVGFGSQNIVNNFMSGLIILAERPIRVGDMIELDGLHAMVEQIGARSTRVKTATNLEIIVPNSSFLESNVVNWTLSDNVIRAKVDVGVAYGAPTRQTEQLLIQAAADHERVIPQPAPFVWFAAFGDNSLNFELHFWVHMSSLAEQRQIESDVRFRVEELLREAGITIAFPQRDVHIDTSGPMEVRVVNESPEAIRSDQRAA